MQRSSSERLLTSAYFTVVVLISFVDVVLDKARASIGASERGRSNRQHISGGLTADNRGSLVPSSPPYLCRHRSARRSSSTAHGHPKGSCTRYEASFLVRQCAIYLRITIAQITLKSS